jgi:predicted nucleic acid-binding protein
MIRAFIDASVIYAACLSSAGASREIIRQAVRGHVSLVISKLVIEEVTRNLSIKTPEALSMWQLFLDAVTFEEVRPTKRQVLEASKYTALKDAPIVAAAKRA